MTDKRVVLVTCGSREEGERIASAVVNEKLAACVNVLPGVRSCYVWEEKLTWSDEVLLVIKSTQARYLELQSRILELHSYDVPEIVALPIEIGLDSYLAWIARACRGTPT